jgi:hypothetical protein
MYSDTYLPGATVAVHCVTYPLSWYVTYLLVFLSVNLPLLLLAVVSWCVHYLFSGTSCSEALYSSLLLVVVPCSFADILCSSSFTLNQLVEICDSWWLSSSTSWSSGVTSSMVLLPSNVWKVMNPWVD